MHKKEEYHIDLKEARRQAKKHYRISESLYDWTDAIKGAFIVVFILFAFLIRTVSVSGSSMVPTLNDKDLLFVNSYESSYHRGDIVVITQPNFLNEPLIKRVIAVGGDTVNIDFEKGIVYVNGKISDSSYTNSPTNRTFMDNMDFPVTVPKGYAFVLGDNRNESLDSRSKSIGFIDERYILGKAVVRMLPFGDWRIYNE